MHRTRSLAPEHGRRASQSGLALVFVLLMTAIAVTAALFTARTTLLGDKASRNERDRQVAFQAAELALNDAELDLMDADLPDTVSAARGCKFAHPAAGLIAGPGCSSDPARRGVCGVNPASAQPIYRQLDWDEADDGQRAYVLFGEFTGRSRQWPTGADAPPAGPPAPAKPPRYIIVQAPAPLQILLESGQTFQLQGAYKVYALGYGINAQTRVMLEGEFYKPVVEKKCG